MELCALVAPVFTPGVYHDMPAEDYHAIEAMSASGAKKMLRTPQHYKMMRTEQSTPTDAMQFGTAVHCAVLEPDSFEARVVRSEKFDRRYKEQKAAAEAFAAEHAGKLILDPYAFDAVRRCADNVRAHPAAVRLLAGAKFEVSILWRDGKYDVPCKLRADALNHGGIIDLKTTTDASPETFARQCASLLYHVQGAAYYSGCEHMLDASPEFFAFIVVENEPPHSVACYTLPSNAIMAGARLFDIALERYRDALQSGVYAGYPNTIEALPFPRWALRFDS